ncbi:ATP phosphoribosyltransferase [Erysipelotrichaceae bacterium]|nr:ATP phosphoribosyltransferase [Erysipelotrichaceae bacterium]
MFLNIALPKGRLGNTAYQMLKKAGYSCAELEGDSRKLVFENEQTKIRFFLVKSSDVQVYVYHGVADIGIVGKDVLDESGIKVLEMLDLKFGICSFAVAGKAGFTYDTRHILKVATKYTKIAAEHYSKKNQEIELVKLNGSVELAPLIGLSDVIVDIVETGTTLRENNLEVIEYFYNSSARLIVNEAGYRFKQAAIDKLLKKLEFEVEQVRGKKDD